MNIDDGSHSSHDESTIGSASWPNRYPYPHPHPNPYQYPHPYPYPCPYPLTPVCRLWLDCFASWPFCVCRNNKQKIMHFPPGTAPTPRAIKVIYLHPRSRLGSSVWPVAAAVATGDDRSFKHFCIIYAILISKSSTRVIIIAEMATDSQVKCGMG